MSVGKAALQAIEAGAAVFLEKGIGSLPLGVASGMGCKLLQTLGPRIGASKTARRNLQRVFPPDRAEEVLRGVWGNLGRTFFEYPHLSSIYRQGFIEFHGADILRRIIAEGTGAVFFSGHLANWECLGAMADVVGVDVGMMYRAPNNPRVADVLARCRASKHLKFIPKSTEGTREAFSTLTNKGFVALLIDHRYNRGVEVDFLGGRAMIAPTAALMVQRYRCPLIPVRAERISPLHHRVTVYEPLAIDWSVPANQLGQSIMQTAMSTLEGWIMERPDQWFWMQRLWR